MISTCPEILQYKKESLQIDYSPGKATQNHITDDKLATLSLLTER